MHLLETQWLTRYPWPTEIVMDRGKEFAKEVQACIKDEYGIRKKLITTRNPQANSIVERVHQVIHNMIRTFSVTDKNSDAVQHGWGGIMSPVRRGVNATVHSTTRATPITQLVFGRDAILNIGFQADWEFIKTRKQKRILDNNQREKKRRKDHTYTIGDKVMIHLNPNRKHGSDRWSGPHTVTRVNDNGTL